MAIGIYELWGVLEYLDAHPLEYATLRRQVISKIIGMLIQEKEITNA
jgi:hypothetical protein